MRKQDEASDTQSRSSSGGGSIPDAEKGLSKQRKKVSRDNHAHRQTVSILGCSCSKKSVMFLLLGVLLVVLSIVVVVVTLLVGTKGDDSVATAAETPSSDGGDVFIPYPAPAPAPAGGDGGGGTLVDFRPVSESEYICQDVPDNQGRAQCVQLTDTLGITSRQWANYYYSTNPGEHGENCEVQAVLSIFHNEEWASYSTERLQQRFSLWVLYCTTGGQDWKFPGLWTTANVHECQWNDPQLLNAAAAASQEQDLANLEACSEYQQEYSRVILPDNNLQGKLPAESPLLIPRLSVLDLSNNLLTGRLPYQWIVPHQECDWYARLGLDPCNRVESLQGLAQGYLDLSNNMLQGPIPLLPLLNHGGFMELRLDYNNFNSISLVNETDRSAFDLALSQRGMPRIGDKWLDAPDATTVHRISLQGNPRLTANLLDANNNGGDNMALGGVSNRQALGILCEANGGGKLVIHVDNAAQMQDWCPCCQDPLSV